MLRTLSILPSCAPAVWMSDRCGRPARSPAAPLRPSRDGCGWASRVPAGAGGVWEGVPVHLQVLAPPETFEVPGGEVLEPVQAFLAGGLGAHRQRARAGVQGAPAQPRSRVPWVSDHSTCWISGRTCARPAWRRVLWLMLAACWQSWMRYRLGWPVGMRA